MSGYPEQSQMGPILTNTEWRPVLLGDKSYALKPACPEDATVLFWAQNNSAQPSFIRMVSTQIDGLAKKICLLFSPSIRDVTFTIFQHISFSSQNTDIHRNDVLPSVVDPLAQSDSKIHHHTISKLIVVKSWLGAQENKMHVWTNGKLLTFPLYHQETQYNQIQCYK